MAQRLRRGFWGALALLALLSFAALARADGPERGHVALSVAGHAGPLQLRAAGGSWSGRFQIQNLGPGTLRVLRVAVLDDAADVRSPPGLGVRLGGPPELAPGESRDVLVSWASLGGVQRAFAQVVVTSTDEERGEVAMGVVAMAPLSLGWAGRHALSLLVLWPLVLVPLALVLGLAGARARGQRRAAVAVLAVECFFAAWALAVFVPGLGRADGNDGFQLVERAVLSAPSGLEWYLGVDATSVVLVLLAAAVGLVAAAGIEDRGPSSHVALALLVSGAIGTFVALDLVVLFVAWQVASLAILIMASDFGASRPAAIAPSGLRIAGLGALGFLALFAAFAAFAHASGPSFLVDGTHAVHTLSVPELSRTSFDASPRVAGLPFADAVWALLLVAVVFAPAATPLRGMLPDALDDAPVPASAMIGAVAITLGPYLLVRLAFPNLPGAARWAAPVLVVLGGIEMVQAATRFVARRDARGAIAQAMMVLAGACLCAVGATRWR